MNSRGERLACAAQTSAESPLSAMIVGVATDPDFRGRGYAKVSVLKLCADCLEEGRLGNLVTSVCRKRKLGHDIKSYSSRSI